MPAQLQTLRRRIRSVRSTKKITKAQELVATSRIAKAQERVAAARPYAEAITHVLTALASNARLDHPLLTPRDPVRRAGLRADDKEVLLYVIGRKGVSYYRFRSRPIEASWTGFSERPDFDHAREVGETVIKAFVNGA